MCQIIWRDACMQTIFMCDPQMKAEDKISAMNLSRNYETEVRPGRSATFLRFVSSQCSEAHRQACSYPYIHLKAVSATITPSDKYVPDYNETTLKNVCDLYMDYNNCTQPFLSTCNKQTVIELQTYDITLGLICKELFSDYLTNRNCFQRLRTSYRSCKDKEVSIINKVNPTGRANTYILCSSSRKYALCVYTATALGCSMSAADVYFKLLNHTISSIFTINKFQCVLRHPMDEISIYTTSPSTTSGIRNAQTTTEKTQDTPKHYKEVSCAESKTSFHLLIYILLSFINYCFKQQILVS